MKQWEMNIKGTTHVKVLADSYEEAINKGLLYIEQENEPNWFDFKIIKNTVEIVSE